MQGKFEFFPSHNMVNKDLFIHPRWLTQLSPLKVWTTPNTRGIQILLLNRYTLMEQSFDIAKFHLQILAR
jgi:hypothetical protein